VTQRRRPPAEEMDVPRPTSAMTPPATVQDDPFTRFVQGTFTPLSRCAVSWCQDWTSAKDLVQESYIRIYGTHPTAEGITIGFVLNALRWELLDHFRQETRNRKLLEKVGKLRVEDGVDDHSGVLITRAEILELARKYQGLGDQNQRERQWEILTLSVLGGFSAKEIGDKLGLSPGTVRNYKSVILSELNKLRES
jgi:RNA polymerase sigma factor (sigma-70 family)